MSSNILKMVYPNSIYFKTLKVSKTFRVFWSAGAKNTNGNDPFELFPFRRFWISSAAASGYGYHGWLVLHLLPACAVRGFISQPIAFGFCLLQHHPPAVLSVFLAEYLPGRSVFQITTWFISRDQKFCCREHFQLFSYRVPRNIEWNLRLSFFRSLFTQPLNERLAFFRVDWTHKIALFVQPLTLPLCKPGGLNDPVFYSAKSLSPSPLLQSNLLSLTWYFKDNSAATLLQLFSAFYINSISTWVINNCS